MNNQNYLTRKDLVRETGAPTYTIDYLTNNNRLHLIKKADGRGSLNIYHRDSIEIIKKHLEKNEFTR